MVYKGHFRLDKISKILPLNLTNSFGKYNSRLFLKHSSILLLANVIVTILGAIRTPLMTWIIPKDEIGMLGVLGTWMPFVQLLSLSGMDASIYHYVSKGYLNAFSIGTKVRLKWSTLSVMIFSFGGIYWIYQKEYILAWLFFIAAISFPVTIGLSACPGYISAMEKYNSLFWYRIWESLTDFTGFIPIVFSLLWSSKIVTFFTSNQIATALMQVIVAIIIFTNLKKSSDKPNLTETDEKRFIRYGKHLTAINTIGTIQSRSDAFIVGAFTPLTTMADYSIGLLVSEQLNKFWNIYVTLRYPKLVMIEKRSRQRRIIQEGIAVTFIIALISIVMIVMAITLIPIILPPAYKTSIRYIILLLISNVVIIPGMITEIYFRTEQYEKNLYAIRIIAAISGLALPLLLVFFWGADGVVFGRIAASFIMSLAGIFYFMQHVRRTQAIQLSNDL